MNNICGQIEGTCLHHSSSDCDPGAPSLHFRPDHDFYPPLFGGHPGPLNPRVAYAYAIGAAISVRFGV